MKNVTEMVDNNMTKEGLVKGNYFEESEDIDIVKIDTGGIVKITYIDYDG